MAITGITARGSAVSNANGTTLSVNPSANIVVGEVLLAASASDNDQTTDGVSSLHTISDSKGNTWYKITEYTETDGASNDGVTVSLWGSLITTQINTTDTVTLTLGASKTDKILTIFEATIGAGKRLVLQQVGVGQNAVSASVTSLPSREYLLVANFGAEGEDTAKTPSTNFTELYDLITSTTGVLDVNIAIHVQYRVATLTSQTATIADWTFTNAMATLSALYEADPVSAAAGLGQVTATGFIPTVTATNNQLVTAGLGEVTANGFDPVVATTNNQNIQIGLGEVIATGFEPTATATDNQNIQTDVGVLSVTGFSPIVTASDNQKAQTDVGVLTLTGYLPTVVASDNQVVQTDVGLVIATGYLPSVVATDNTEADTFTGVLTLNGFAPSLKSTIRTDVGQLQIQGYEVTIGTYVHPIHGDLLIVGFIPTVDVSGGGSVTITTNVGQCVVNGYQPTIKTTITTDFGELVVSGFEPTIKSPISPNVGQLVVVGLSPVVLTPRLVVTETGQLSVNGYEANITINVNVLSQKGDILVDGFAPDITAPALVLPGFGQLIFVGFAPKISGIYTYEINKYSGIKNNELEGSEINNGNRYSGSKSSVTIKSTVKDVF